jgi:hypothetical protein
LKKHLFRSLLCCCIVLAALTAVVLAADASNIPTQVIVSGTDVTKGGCWTVDSQGNLTPGGKTSDPGTVTYDPASGTLTLRNAVISKLLPGEHDHDDHRYSSGIYAENGHLTIRLEGHNAIPNGPDMFNGIYVEQGDLTICGEGDLDLTVTTTVYYGNYGIYADNLTMQSGNLRLAVEGKGPAFGRMAVQAGRMVISGGSVAVTVKEDATTGFSGKVLDIRGGTVTVTAENEAMGVNVKELYVSDAFLTTEADASSRGIIPYISKIEIRGSVVQMNTHDTFQLSWSWPTDTELIVGDRLVVPTGAVWDLSPFAQIGPDAAIENHGTLVLPEDLAPDGAAVGALNITGSGTVLVPTAEWDYLYQNDGTLLGTRLPFDDVSEGAWFYNDVKTAYTSGLMGGVGSRRFAPEEPASRAMIVTILWRQAGSPQVNYAMQFDDVPKDAWYTEAVRWAVSEGIVSGYGDRTFGPDDPITREQMAVLLHRCAEKAGLDTSFQGQELEAFADRDQVSSYAREAAAWAVRTKLLGGVRTDTLAPQGQTTRAQAAAILLRWDRMTAA